MARGFAVIASDIVHTGRYSLNVETGSTEFYELESFSSTYVRVYVYFGSQPTTTYWEVLRVYTSMEPHRVQIATLAILSDRRIQVWNLGAIPAIVQGDMQAVTGAWNCIELKVIPGTGKGQRSNQNAIVEARLDGLMTATSTNGSDFGTISRVTFGYSPGEFGIVRLDDAIARSDGYPGPM